MGQGRMVHPFIYPLPMKAHRNNFASINRPWKSKRRQRTGMPVRDQFRWG